MAIVDCTTSWLDVVQIVKRTPDVMFILLVTCKLSVAVRSFFDTERNYCCCLRNPLTKSKLWDACRLLLARSKHSTAPVPLSPLMRSSIPEIDISYSAERRVPRLTDSNLVEYDSPRSIGRHNLTTTSFSPPFPPSFDMDREAHDDFATADSKSGGINHMNFPNSRVNGSSLRRSGYLGSSSLIPKRRRSEDDVQDLRRYILLLLLLLQPLPIDPIICKLGTQIHPLSSIAQEPLRVAQANDHSRLARLGGWTTQQDRCGRHESHLEEHEHGQSQTVMKVLRFLFTAYLSL